MGTYEAVQPRLTRARPRHGSPALWSLARWSDDEATPALASATCAKDSLSHLRQKIFIDLLKPARDRAEVVLKPRGFERRFADRAGVVGHHCDLTSRAS